MNAATSLFDRTEHNLVAARLLAAPAAGIAALVSGLIMGVTVRPWAGLTAAGIAALIVILIMPRTATAGVLAVVGGEPVSESAQPRLYNLVDGLGATSGAGVSQVLMLDDESANLAAIGSAHDATLVVTAGLLGALDRVELEAVVAEGMARIRSNDAHLATQAALFVCGPLVRHGPRTRSSVRSMATFMAERRSARLTRVLGPQREFLADLAAVDLTHYPPGLASALTKMAARGTGVESATWGTAHLWMAEPLREPDDPTDVTAVTLNGLFGLHEDIEQRTALMAEL